MTDKQDDDKAAVALDWFIVTVNRAERALEQLDQAWGALPDEVKRSLRPPVMSDPRQAHDRDDRQQQPK